MSLDSRGSRPAAAAGYPVAIAALEIPAVTSGNGGDAGLELALAIAALPLSFLAGVALRRWWAIPLPLVVLLALASLSSAWRTEHDLADVWIRLAATAAFEIAAVAAGVAAGLVLTRRRAARGVRGSPPGGSKHASGSP